MMSVTVAGKIRKQWRPVSKYADLDDFVNSLRNREALRRFLMDFEWLEFMFNPEAYDFHKFLEGDESWRLKPRDGVGFSRLPDPTLRELGGYARAFRDKESVVISVTAERLDPKKVVEWNRRHGTVSVVCDPSRSFRSNGRAQMVLFMLEPVRERFREKLDEYMSPIDLFAKDIYEKDRRPAEADIESKEDEDDVECGE